MSAENDKIIENELKKNKGKSELNELSELEINNKKKKELVQEKKGFLENPKMVRRVRLIIVGLIVFFLPLMYFLISNNLSLDALLSWNMGALMLITTIGTLLNTIETKKTTFEDVVDENSDISNNEIEITENGEWLSKNIIVSMPILNAYNDELQNSYDNQKTTKKISKIKRKIAVIKVSLNRNKVKKFGKLANFTFVIVLLNKLLIFHKSNRIERKENKINRLEATPLKDRKFKPYRFERLLSSRSSNRYTKIGDGKINTSPDKISVKSTVIKVPLKGLGMSMVGGAIPLALGVDFWTLLAFYVGYSLGQLFTTFSQYILTKYKTTHDYREAQVEKKRLQKYLKDEIEKKNKADMNLAKVEKVVEKVVKPIGETPIIEVKKESILNTIGDNRFKQIPPIQL